MADQNDSPSLFNPFLLWADWGMRAAEAAMASTQNITDGADRVTRAVASAEPGRLVEPPAGSDAGATAAMGGIADMQRLAWDLAARNWTQWMSTVSSLMSAGTGMGREGAGAASPLQALRDSLMPAAWTAQPAADGRTARATTQAPARSQGRSGVGLAQHALASDAPRPRRKAAKTRRTARASRK
jgi:hypothetical protein